jgi:hypothetical protein
MIRVCKNRFDLYSFMHVIFLCLDDFNVSYEDSDRVSKEIEDLRSQLALKKKELKCYRENKQLRVKLALKVKDAECIRKENEELKAQNKDLQENVCFQLQVGITNASVHLQKQMIIVSQETFLLQPILIL